MIWEKIHKIISIYGNKIKVIWWIIAVWAMIIAVQTYVNYSTIVDEEKKVNQDIKALEQEIAYSQNFYIRYLDSDYSSYFLAHKNNILFDWEYVLKLAIGNEVISGSEIDTWNVVESNTPQESWKIFIKSKLN